jgi:hypothetical protein
LIEEENPHRPHLAPQKMYKVRDAARRALQVNGPTGENLQLRQQRRDDEQQRAETAQRIEAEQKAAAEALKPKNLEEELCKIAGVAPWSNLTKEKTLLKFNLESRELEDLGVDCMLKPNPKNPRFKPMRLYKAGDVATALAKKQQSAEALQQQRNEKVAELLAARCAARTALRKLQSIERSCVLAQPFTIVATQS